MCGHDLHQSVATYTTPEPAQGRKGRLLQFAILFVGILSGLGAAALLVYDRYITPRINEQRFISELKKEGLSSGNRAVDISGGRAVCDRLNDGDRPAGSEKDKIAVRFFCPEFASGFKVLDTRIVRGRFFLLDPETEDLGCDSGAGGYGDINSSTQVVVKSPNGNELARTELGQGRSYFGYGSGVCLWEFRIELTEGERLYIVEIGARGEFSYAWEEIIKPNAISIYLGFEP